MTSAWYTNVVQTSGLTFEAEAWGFEGDITIGNEGIVAAPGDDGIIELTVKNNSDSVSAITVNVSKNTMADEMKKRLFFYVDTRVNQNGETMERVYLNRMEGYTYHVFNNSRLTLTEELSTAPQIKWEWVYDVLGYYVIAEPYMVEVDTVGEDGTQTKVSVTKMDIREYLRPIIYDFDQATTTVNTDGESISMELSTVDGERTPEQFLQALSLTDGYTGTINTTNPVLGSYYPVEVDASGYGVYAYLCNYSQIEEETRYDAKLGKLAVRKANNDTTLTNEELAMLTHSVTITLSAQKSNDATLAVSTLDALNQALNLGVSTVIQLEDDISLAAGDMILIPENKQVILDLGGHTVMSSNTAGAAIAAQEGSSLVLTNGTLQYDKDIAATGTTYGVRTTGAEVVMNGVTVDGFSHGVYVGDNAVDNDLDSRVHILNSTLNGDICAVFISGNGLVSDQKSQLIIENSTLTSGNFAISGNGDTSGNGRWGTDIQIINSDLIGTGDGIGIYQPQKNSTLTIKDSRVTGYTGIALKGGSARILDGSVITGTGEFVKPNPENSGVTNTGDAIYIEANYGYEIYLLVGNDVELIASKENCMKVRVDDENAANVRIEYEAASAEGESTEGEASEGDESNETE